ncbi:MULTISPECIES: glutamyl-tRNA reductase [unclassified Arthrobacter]|uniref:glutamyl-tRNA reductase n=1 Tax=unclassified Arthrobacter TaxID=235627 RepID=UPI000367110C|nr:MULTISPECIES: glutamyl-tRNA reductase [unclassified Arthrobacter]PVE17820.1 glutamyl-tRNA reductase [Arthrobacter sp. Bz4]
MVLLSLVATHSDVDLETVARLSVGADQVASAVLADGPAVSGAVTLATCNRLEIYCDAASADDVEAARSAVITRISGLSGLPESWVSSAFTTRTGEDVARHLFAVGAGLDSAVVGEREIAGQVRRALIESQANGTTSGPLVRLFQEASRTAKDVGAQTALGSQGRSIVSVALELAADLSLTREFTDKSVVVFGTGAYAGATMALLKEKGCTDISVFSSSGRSEAFVSTRGGVALTADDLPAALATADIVVGCSGSDNRVEAADVERVRASVDKQLIVVDLALSHDFDPAVGSLDDVELITLESVRLAAPSEQAAALSQASSLVAEAARSFQDRQNSRAMDTAIVALRKHTQQVLESEMQKVRAQHGCTAAAEEVEFALRRMVRQLLHVPTVRARELAAEGRQQDYAAALEALYGIDLEAPADQSAEASCPVRQDPPATGTA